MQDSEQIFFFVKLSMKLFKTKNCNNLKFKLINFKEFKIHGQGLVCHSDLLLEHRKMDEEVLIDVFIVQLVHVKTVVAWHPPILFRSRNHSSCSLLSNAPFLATVPITVAFCIEATYIF